MTCTLLLLRHAKSSWHDPGLRDHDRPLNKRGERDAPRMGALMAAEDMVPDLVLTSTAVRAKRTAELCAEAAGMVGTVASVEDLYLANPATILSTVERRGGDARTVLVVAHNPGCEELLARLTGKEERFPTAALARIEFEIPTWAEVGLDAPARLTGMWRPKELSEDRS